MSKNTQRITLSAMFAAMICVLTFFPKVPVVATGGYIHLGDGLCLVSAYLLGPVFGGLSAGIGSAISDAIGGYGIYVPATFIIKTVAYFLAGVVFKVLKGRKLPKMPTLIISACIAETVMVGGYFLFEWLITDSKFVAALSAVPANIVQGVAGIAVGTVVTEVIHNNKQLNKFFNN